MPSVSSSSIVDKRIRIARKDAGAGRAVHAPLAALPALNVVVAVDYGAAQLRHTMSNWLQNFAIWSALFSSPVMTL